MHVIKSKMEGKREEKIYGSNTERLLLAAIAGKLSRRDSPLTLSK